MWSSRGGWFPLLLFFLAALVQHAEQRGDGAPAGACLDMMPAHSGIPPQTSVPPYVVRPSASQVHQGARLNVSIVGVADTPVAGFLLQARKLQNENATLGKWTRVPNPAQERVFSCRGDNDSVTHATPDNKFHLTFEWEAPTDFLGGLEFRATVAQTYSTFWKNVKSAAVEVVTPDTVITTPPPGATTRSLYVTPPPPRTQNSDGVVRRDPIYEGCDESKLCFGLPGPCLAKGTCAAVVAVFVVGRVYTFELQALDSPKYVAAALSMDKNMGDDSAMECVQNNGRVTLHTSWTYPKDEPYVSRKDSPQAIVQLLNSSFVDGKLYCRFTRDWNTSVKGNSFDLVNKQFNLMVVAGSSMKDQERVGFHDKVFGASDGALSLASVGSVAGASKLLLKLHGSFMLLAWLATSSIGMLLARYFRQTWVGKTFGGKDIWFAWHRILMVLTWLLTVVAFVLILVEAGGWTGTGDNPHAITGLVTIILCFLQPIGAFFRPHPGTPKRPIFNWGHWFGGNAAHILGIATIFLAVYLPKAELPEWSVFILVAFVILHVIVHLILSVAMCVSDGRISRSRVNTFPMKDMVTGSGHLPSIDRSIDAPHAAFRRLMLSVYVFLAIVLCVAMICLVALAPIAEAYNTVTSAISDAMTMN